MRDRDPRPTLYAKWSRREGAHVYGGVNRPDGRLLCHLLETLPVHDGKSFVKELEERGYDLTTLRVTARRNRAPHTGDDAVDTAANARIDAWRERRQKK